MILPDITPELVMTVAGIREPNTLRLILKEGGVVTTHQAAQEIVGPFLLAASAEPESPQPPLSEDTHITIEEFELGEYGQTVL